MNEVGVILKQTIITFIVSTQQYNNFGTCSLKSASLLETQMLRDEPPADVSVGKEEEEGRNRNMSYRQMQ